MCAKRERRMQEMRLSLWAELVSVRRNGHTFGGSEAQLACFGKAPFANL